MHPPARAGSKSFLLTACALLTLCPPYSLVAASLYGTVYGQNETPIHGARITAWEPGTDRRYQRTAENGRYSFDKIAEGNYLLKAEHTGMAVLLGAARLVRDDHHEMNLFLVGNAGIAGPEIRAGSSDSAFALRPPRLSKVQAGRVKQSRLLHQVQPDYPRKQWAFGMKLQITAVIRTDGILDDIIVLSAPDADWAVATLLALRQWRYSPTYLDGRPVEVRTTMDISPHGY